MEPIALQWGIQSDKYWMLTFGEMMMQVNANKIRREEELKQKAMFDYNLAQLVTYAFNKPEKMPKAQDVYSILKEDAAETPKVSINVPGESTEYNMEADRAILLQRTAIIQSKVGKNELEDGGE